MLERIVFVSSSSKTEKNRRMINICRGARYSNIDNFERIHVARKSRVVSAMAAFLSS